MTQGWYYVESLTGQCHDGVQTESQIATVDSCFDLIGSQFGFQFGLHRVIAPLSFQLSDEYRIVEVQVVEMTEAVATKQASVTTLHLSVVWAFFTKLKFLIVNRGS